MAGCHRLDCHRADFGWRLRGQRRTFAPPGRDRPACRVAATQLQLPSGVVSSVSFESTTNTARSLAGFVLLALALTAWRSPGISEKLCPALYVVTGPSLTWLRIAPSRTVA